MAGDKTNSDKTEPSSIDHASPFYLHPSDYPRQMQVNDVLSDSNYIDWSQEMVNFLFAKNKIGFVDETIKKPEPNSKDYMAWMRCDAMVKGWLSTAMEKEIRNSIKYTKTAGEMWSDLKERFAKQSASRAYELKQMLTSTRQDRSSVSTNYTKLRILWDELESVLPTPRCSCDKCMCDIGKKLTEMKEKERLYEFLLELDAEFTTIRTQNLAMNPAPTLGTVYHLASEDEQQRSIASGKKPTAETAAFHVATPSKRDSSHWKGSVQKEIRKSPGEATEHYDFCGRDGHSRDGCFKRIKYPDWWPGKKGEKARNKSAAHVDVDSSSIQGLSGEQYKQFLNLFNEAKKSDSGPKVNVVQGNPSAM